MLFAERRQNREMQRSKHRVYFIQYHEMFKKSFSISGLFSGKRIENSIHLLDPEEKLLHFQATDTELFQFCRNVFAILRLN